MRRVLIGSWSCPSGNSVDAFYRSLGDRQATIEMEWDIIPLSPADGGYYATTIRPALLIRVREYTESIGATVVVDL